MGAIVDRLNLLQYSSRVLFSQGLEISNVQAPVTCSKNCSVRKEPILAG